MKTPCRHVSIVPVAFALCLAQAGPAFGQIGPGPKPRPLTTMPVARSSSGGSGQRAIKSVKLAAAQKWLHLPADKTVSLSPFQLNDSGGFRWDILNHGGVGQGTNNLFSNGCFLQVNNNNFHFSNGRGNLSKDGREIETGPWNYANLTFHRRIRIYDDRPLARWIEIIENKTSDAQTVQVSIRNYLNYGLSQIVNDETNARYGEKQFAYIGLHRNSGNSVPQFLHIVGDKKSKFNPTVETSGNQVYVRYNVTVPAGSAVAICHFMSQGNTRDDLTKLLNGFDSSKVLKDLPSSLRRLIANIGGSWLMDDLPDMERSTAADLIMLDDGDLLLGKIDVEQYVVKTFYGDLKVPARRVIGMLSQASKSSGVLLVLVDGQIVFGELAVKQIPFTHSTGSVLKVDVSRIRQIGYRIAEDKPEEIEFSDPLLVFRTGERLAFDPAEAELTLHSPHGQVTLPAAGLLSVDFDVPGAVHRVNFLNGSRLGGIVGPETIKVKPRLAPEALEIDRQNLRRIVFATEAQEPEGLARVALGNDDELIGRLTDEKLTLQTDFGPVAFSPNNLQTLWADPSKPGNVRLGLWDGSTVRGKLAATSLGFAIEPDGPTLQLDLAQPVTISCPTPLPPAKLIKEIEDMIARLGSDVFADRKNASAKLTALGRPALPLLKGHLNDPDPEIRQRVKDIVEKIGGNPDATPSGGATDRLNSVPMPAGLFLRAR